tara:strand:- start:11269 stop:11808 length:540 start_codon:yes stop_codon:yes gene_type:complete
MKGVVFTEFLELFENKFGLEVVNQIIEGCELETDGIYTSVGTYSPKDMFKMVGKLSELKDIPVSDLLEIYGDYFFDFLSKGYPQFMDQPNSFSFFESMDSHIHPEVLKIYPEAELLSFDAEINAENDMTLLYKSSRTMSDFAVGLIKGAISYFNEKVTIEKLSEENNGEIVLINICKIG